MKISKKHFLIVLIFLVILFTTLIASFSYAKYVTKVNGQVLGKIAKPIIELKGEKSLLITTALPKISYNFEVRNYTESQEDDERKNAIEIENADGEQNVNKIENSDERENINISEIDMQYYIEIISEAEGVDFELYNGNNKIELENKKTKLIDMPKMKKHEHKYRLDILYNKEEKDLNIKDNIEIRIYSTQKI